MTDLVGRTLLVVEDEAIVAVMVAEILQEHGATVLGPVGSFGAAMLLAEDPRIDAAILDVNLRGEAVDPIALRLFNRGIPFAFATGYGSRPEGPWREARVISKPFNEATVLDAVRSLFLGRDCR
ncbi:MAG: response regulator [Amaricoccus sp.]